MANRLPLAAGAVREPGGGTLSANIIARMRARLFAGHLRPGDHLGGEASLAETFGVSRMAMRDALRTLAATGVIEVRRGAGGGVRVAAAEVGRVADAFAIQLTLLGVSRSDLIEAQIATEAMITRLAAERAGPADVVGLRALLARAGADADNGIAFAQAIGAFHTDLARIAGNPSLAVMLRGILQLLEAVYVGDTTPERAAGVLRHYDGVIDAIVGADGELAAARMRIHLANVLAYAQSDDDCPADIAAQVERPAHV